MNTSLNGAFFEMSNKAPNKSLASDVTWCTSSKTISQYGGGPPDSPTNLSLIACASVRYASNLRRHESTSNSAPGVSGKFPLTDMGRACHRHQIYAIVKPLSPPPYPKADRDTSKQIDVVLHAYDSLTNLPPMSIYQSRQFRGLPYKGDPDSNQSSRPEIASTLP